MQPLVLSIHTYVEILNKGAFAFPSQIYTFNEPSYVKCINYITIWYLWKTLLKSLKANKYTT